MMSLVKKAYFTTTAIFKELMIFLINPEHSVGCDSLCLGEVSNSLVSKEKFRHDLPRVHQSVWTLGLMIRGGRVPTHQSI